MDICINCVFSKIENATKDLICYCLKNKISYKKQVTYGQEGCIYFRYKEGTENE